MAKLALTLTLVLSSLSAFSAGTGEMSERELSNKFIATIQESKIEDQLTQSSEFKTCASKSKLEKGKSGKVNDDAIAAIEKCFTEKIKGQNPKQLDKLSEKLGLQSYGLVKSKSAEDITKYISKKINKALTGVDPDEKDLKAMIDSSKFKNRNIVDQSVFFRLYQTQLGKNVLFEISRFCYQDLRNTDITDKDKIPKNFKIYWGGDDSTFKLANALKPEDLQKNLKSTNPYKVTDSDKDPQDKEIYAYNVETNNDEESKDQLNKIAETFRDIDPSFSESFFTFCSRLIKPMCNIFEENTTKCNQSDKKDTAACNNKFGAKACLTQSRLEQYRKALTKTAEYLKKIEEDPQSGITFNIANMKVYDGKGENSIDSITSISSTDIMESRSKEYKAKIENFDTAKCTSSPELAECEVLIDEEQSNFEIDNINLKMSVRNAAEIQRIKSLIDANDKNLEQYLTENGYADILAEIKKPTGKNIEEMLKSKFDGRKEAYIKELQNKIGSQQVKDTKGDRTKQTDDVMEEIKNQPAQLAQLVMFNNIISSSFELKNAKDESLGRNTSGLDREMKDAKTTGLEMSYFDGIKGTTGDQPKNNSNDNNSITGLQFLDSILGFEDTEETPK